MQENSVRRVVHLAGLRALRDAETQLSDAELLRRFQAEHDRLSLELLIWRHGPLVRGVCQRLLSNAPDADDAVQATFFILVAKAHSIRQRGSLAGWLHHVARRVCLRHHRQTIRRTSRERQHARNEAIVDIDLLERAELRHVIDEEVEKLPMAYRDAFLLLQWEGRSGEDAARELDCATGTVYSRFARAKERLRNRLLKRGVVPAVALTTSTVNAREVFDTAMAAAQYCQGSAVSESVAVLTKGVLTSMAATQFKLICMALAAVVAVAGVGTGLVFPDRSNAQARTEVRSVQPTADELQKELDRLQKDLNALKSKLSDLRETKVGATPIRTIPEDYPTDAEILRALPVLPRNQIVEIARDDVTIVREKIFDRIDAEARFFPLVGMARLHRVHWKCTVYCAETTTSEYPFPFKTKKRCVHIVYIDKDNLLVVGRGPVER